MKTIPRYELWRRQGKSVYDQCNEWDLLHPSVKDDFGLLSDMLQTAYKKGETRTLFLPFETYRTPQLQYKYYTGVDRVTKAGPWESSHNYGMAVDFVPFVELTKEEKIANRTADAFMWQWDGPHDWDFLDKCVAKIPNLERPISWDRPHIEHTLFRFFRRI